MSGMRYVLFLRFPIAVFNPQGGGKDKETRQQDPRIFLLSFTNSLLIALPGRLPPLEDIRVIAVLFDAHWF